MKWEAITLIRPAEIRVPRVQELEGEGDIPALHEFFVDAFPVVGFPWFVRRPRGSSCQWRG